MDIKYSIWSPLYIQKHVDKNIVDADYLSQKRLFRNFKYFDVEIAKTRYYDETYHYNNDGLTRLETQEAYCKDPVDYARFVVALDNSKVVGLVVCKWIKGHHNQFWRYFQSYIEVSSEADENNVKKYRGRGIGKSLIKTLYSVDFFKGKILQRNSFEDDGFRFFSQ